MRRSEAEGLPVFIRIEGAFIEGEGAAGDGERVVSELLGTYHAADGIHLIQYEDVKAGTPERNLIRADERTLYYKRTGCGPMIFRAGEVHSLSYGTEYGAIEMDIKTLYYSLGSSEGLPGIKARYELIMGGVSSGIRELEITLKSRTAYLYSIS